MRFLVGLIFRDFKVLRVLYNFTGKTSKNDSYRKKGERKRINSFPVAMSENYIFS